PPAFWGFLPPLTAFLPPPWLVKNGWVSLSGRHWAIVRALPAQICSFLTPLLELFIKLVNQSLPLTQILIS
ncbi:MAG: hypothetical protein AAF703_06785, partial [Cyanobacteria bacterium P01_D01_bin.105]